MKAPTDLRRSHDVLPEPLKARLLERLGFSGPPPLDIDGLRAFYAAWCRSVPFDNVRKVIALRSDPEGPLPGVHAEEFFACWLESGAGGTCWASANALFTLVYSLGFDARRVAGSMFDTNVANHGTVKVQLEGRDWLLDSAMLTNEPLPLGDKVFIHRDPVHAAEVEPIDGTHRLWFDLPPNSQCFPCRLLEDPVDHAYFTGRYEISRNTGPFNQRLYARRNAPGEMRIFVGRTRFSKTTQGVESRDLSREELCRALHEDIGLSDELIEQWARRGGLDASLEPPTTPAPPPFPGKPPSQR